MLGPSSEDLSATTRETETGRDPGQAPRQREPSKATHLIFPRVSNPERGRVTTTNLRRQGAEKGHKDSAQSTLLKQLSNVSVRRSEAPERGRPAPSNSANRLRVLGKIWPTSAGAAPNLVESAPNSAERAQIYPIPGQLWPSLLEVCTTSLSIEPNV